MFRALSGSALWLGTMLLLLNLRKIITSPRGIVVVVLYTALLLTRSALRAAPKPQT